MSSPETRHCDVLILGAGAAGLMCGIEAARRGRKALVIDHAEKPAEKIHTLVCQVRRLTVDRLVRHCSPRFA
jgi:thioredoxin reductase